MSFSLIIIGDEILHGSRQDKHFAFFKQLLKERGLLLDFVQYLPDKSLSTACAKVLPKACPPLLPAASAARPTTTPAKPLPKL